MRMLKAEEARSRLRRYRHRLEGGIVHGGDIEIFLVPKAVKLPKDPPVQALRAQFDHVATLPVSGPAFVLVDADTWAKASRKVVEKLLEEALTDG